MKISVISRYPPQKCGIAWVAYNFVEGLKECGAEVEVIAFKGYEYRDDKIKAMLGKDSLMSYIRAVNYIAKNNFDAVVIEHEYVHYNPIMFPFFLAYLKLRGIKINIVMHTIAKYNDFLKRTIFKLWNSSFLLFTDRLYIHTDYAAKKIKKETFFQPRNTSLLNIPIEHKRKKFGAIREGNVKNLLAQGFMAEDKGYHLIVDAFGGEKGYKVKIAGTVNESSMKKQHDYFDMIKKKAMKYDNIEIIDKFLSEKEKDEVIEWCDFIMLPYTKTEQSANLTTAWSFYKIPICSDIIPLKEEVKDNKYGILFKNNDSSNLKRVLDQYKDNVDVQKEIIENIKKLVDERSYKQMAKKFIETLELSRKTKTRLQNER